MEDRPWEAEQKERSHLGHWRIHRATAKAPDCLSADSGKRKITSHWFYTLSFIFLLLATEHNPQLVNRGSAGRMFEPENACVLRALLIPNVRASEMVPPLPLKTIK